MGIIATRSVGCATALAVVVTMLAAVDVARPAAAAGTDAFCGLEGTPGLTTYRWSGGTGNWFDTGSWGAVPGGRPGLGSASSETDYVCIDAGVGGVVTLDSSLNAIQVQAVDVAAGTTLRLVDNGKLYTHGDPDQRPTVVRGRLTVGPASSIGGPGRLRIDGSLGVVGVSAITSDTCFGVPTGQTCPGLTGTGELVVSRGATFAIAGDRPINLLQGFALTVAGTMTLSGSGSFVAADRDTSLTIAPGGRLELRNDGGIYEGFARNGTRLADLVNAGTIIKTGGTGVSSLDVTYRREGAGRLVVESGSVTLPGGATTGVTVDGGSGFGTGTCRARPAQQCEPVVVDSDPENGRVTPNRRTSVSVVEGARRASTRDLAVPVVYSFGAGSVVRVQLAYAPGLVGARTRLDVWRAPSRDGRYVPLRVCPRTSKLPARWQSCYDRQASRIRHSGGARLVVRTRVGGSLVARSPR